MSTQSATVYAEIFMGADKHGKPRFRYLSTRQIRTFPVKKSDALASLAAGCRVYVGTFNDLLCGRGHYATDAELADWGVSR